MLTKLWDRYGKDANKNGAFVCILHMARIDPPLALKWSAQAGGRYDAPGQPGGGGGPRRDRRRRGARAAHGARRGSSQYILQRLAERFAGRTARRR